MATLQRPLSLRSATQVETQSFDALAVPQAPSISSLRRQVDSVGSNERDDDLISLGQESLFSGTRSRVLDIDATAQSPGATFASNTITPSAPSLNATPTTVSEESLGQLGAAKVAFLSALHGLLQPYLSVHVRETEPNHDSTNQSNAIASSSTAPTTIDSSKVATLEAPDVEATRPDEEDRLLAQFVKSLRLHAEATQEAEPLMTQSLTSVSPLLDSSPSISSKQVAATNRPVLVNELQARVNALAPQLLPIDAQLARALGALLACMERLSSIAHVPTRPSQPRHARSSSRAAATTSSSPELDAEFSTSANVYERLEKEAKALQMSKDEVPAEDARALANVFGAAREVERAERDLLWGRIDDLSERVRALCRERGESLIEEQEGSSNNEAVEELGVGAFLPQSSAGRKSIDRNSDYALSIASAGDLPTYSTEPHSATTPHLPPAYFADYTVDSKSDVESLQDTSDSALITSLPRMSQARNEKMQRDLDSVSQAIERLYAVSPQLANQRVEPDRRKLRERQLAKLGNAIERLSKGRLDDQRATPMIDEGPDQKIARNQRIQDVMLDKLIDQINKAASRTLVDQRVDIKGKQRDPLLNAATYKDDGFEMADPGEAARREFILEHTGKGRLQSQDAVLHSIHPFDAFPGPPSASEKSPSSNSIFSADYSLDNPAIKDPSIKRRFSNLRLGVFKRPASPSTSRRGSYDARIDMTDKSSALNVSRRGSHDVNAMRTPDGSTGLGVLGLGSRRGSLAVNEILPVSALDYIVEESRNLGTLVITFWPRASTSLHQEWELTAVEGESVLIAPASGGPQSRIILPSRVITQDANVTSHGSFFEVKLVTLEPSPTRSRADLEVHAPLSTTELRASLPQSFACAVCHAVLADTSQISKYNSLPSEHWAELLDAWMCHQDQRLSDDLVEKGKGIKPREDEVLVGSKFIVIPSKFIKDCVPMPMSGDPERTDNGDTLYPAQCSSCSSLVGFDISPADSADTSAKNFRLLKLAAYPISLRAPGSILKHAPRYSLASHVTAEMLELGQAHACHRFIVEDREEDKARLLLWLFNPSVRVSFATRSTEASRLLKPAGPQAAHPGSPDDDKLIRRSMNVVKIFYIVVKDENDEKCREFIASPMSTCERIQYPLSVTSRLTDLLRASTSVYPPSQREWGDHEVGFLERL